MSAELSGKVAGFERRDGITQTEIVKTIGKRWRSISAVALAHYKQRAAEPWKELPRPPDMPMTVEEEEEQARAETAAAAGTGCSEGGGAQGVGGDERQELAAEKAANMAAKPKSVAACIVAEGKAATQVEAAPAAEAAVPADGGAAATETTPACSAVVEAEDIAQVQSAAAAAFPETNASSTAKVVAGAEISICPKRPHEDEVKGGAAEKKVKKTFD